MIIMDITWELFFWESRSFIRSFHEFSQDLMINQTWPIFDDDDSGAVSVTARSRRVRVVSFGPNFLLGRTVFDLCW